MHQNKQIERFLTLAQLNMHRDPCILIPWFKWKQKTSLIQRHEGSVSDNIRTPRTQLHPVHFVVASLTSLISRPSRH